MKVLFIKNRLLYGGAEKMMLFVARSFLKDGHDVSILLYDSESITQEIEKGISIYNYKFTCNGALKHVKIIRRICSVVKSINPDIIISFLHFPNFYSSIVGKLLRIPVIISERGNPYALNSFKDKVLYSFYNLATGAVFQSEGAKRYFSKSLQDRSCIIPNPVISKPGLKKYNSSLNNHEISFIARMDIHQKRQDLMIMALNIVRKVYPDVKLRLWGTGKDLEHVQQLVNDYKLNDFVSFCGYTTTPEEEMVKTEVFVLSSDYEGIPNSVIEAMSVGMPVVATDCDPGGVRLLIEDGINGFIVNKGDYKAIAERIIEMFDNEHLRCKISKEAYKINTNYSEVVIAAKWLDYAKNVLKKFRK